MYVYVRECVYVRVYGRAHVCAFYGRDTRVVCVVARLKDGIKCTSMWGAVILER